MAPAHSPPYFLISPYTLAVYSLPALAGFRKQIFKENMWFVVFIQFPAGWHGQGNAFKTIPVAILKENFMSGGNQISGFDAAPFHLALFYRKGKKGRGGETPAMNDVIEKEQLS